MARRKQKVRREQGRARAEVERMVADQERGAYRAPDRRDCSPRAWYQSVDDADTIRVDHRLFRSAGQLVDFAILVLSLDIDGTWIERARADCCHGHVHLHHATGEVQSIGPLHNEEDVARLFDIASALVTKYAITLRDTKGKE